MSLGEDAKQDMYCSQAEEDSLRDRKLWKTLSGKNIPISKMTDAHLLNAHRLVSENEHWVQADIFLEEIEKRGLKPLLCRERDEEATYGIGYVAGMKDE